VVFYDVHEFNTDTLYVGTNSTSLAEMYFRIDIEEVKHSLNVYRFMDFLGDVGGITEVLTRCAFFLLGGYLSWHQ